MDLLGNTSVTTKVIHYATFERSVLGRHCFVIEPVVDTRDLSGARHGGVGRCDRNRPRVDFIAKPDGQTHGMCLPCHRPRYLCRQTGDSQSFTLWSSGTIRSAWQQRALMGLPPPTRRHRRCPS